MSRLAFVALLVLACRSKEPAPTPEADTDTDTDTDADADTDTDADCASSIGLNLSVEPADPGSPDYNGYEWDQGVAVSACVANGEIVAGQAQRFIRAVDQGPGATWCAELFTLDGSPETSCDPCTFAFAPALTLVDTVDAYAPGTLCSYLEEVREMPSWGVDTTAPPTLYISGKGWYTPDATVSVTTFPDAVRVDWLWQDYRNID